RRGARGGADPDSRRGSPGDRARARGARRPLSRPRDAGRAREGRVDAGRALRGRALRGRCGVTTIPPRRGAIVVASLFTTLFLVFGSGYNTAGVFVAPLVAQFGWTRAQVSLLQTTVALAAGLVLPGVGWL